MLSRITLKICIKLHRLSCLFHVSGLILPGILLLVLLGIGSNGAPSSSPRLILDDEYFRIVHHELRNAKDSIYLIAHLFLYYDYEKAYPNLILGDLIKAHKRGVKVKVVLDYPKAEYVDKDGISNQKAYEKLKSARVDVRFNSAKTTTHNKVLVIDGETVILGSHNYTLSGLKYNHETSILIRNRTIAEELISYFEKIKEE